MSEKEFKGLTGESLTKRLIEDNIKIYKHVMHDVKLIDGNSKTQIDNILITSRGIFVIENKNINTLVVNNENSDIWTCYYAKESYPLNPNPVEQNRHHIEILAKFLGVEESEIKSYIVFGYESSLCIKNHYDNVKIVKIQDIIDEIKDDIKNSENKMAIEQIDDMYIKLNY